MKNKYRPITNRFLGLAKVFAGFAYWGVTVSSGPAVPIFFALVGAPLIVTGLAIKSIGKKFGWRKTEEFGADMQDVGVKILSSPIWVSCFALDGIGNIVTGSKENWLSKWGFNIKKVEARYAQEDRKSDEQLERVANSRGVKSEGRDFGREKININTQDRQNESLEDLEFEEPNPTKDPSNNKPNRAQNNSNFSSSPVHRATNTHPNQWHHR